MYGTRTQRYYGPDLKEEAYELIAATFTGSTLDDLEGADFSDELQDAVHNRAEGMVIYYGDVREVINRLQNHPAVPEISDIGGNYRADQWRDAMTAWAYEVAYSVLSSGVQEALAELLEAGEEFLERAEELADDIDAKNVMASTFDAMGYFPPSTVDARGFHHFTDRQVDGDNALAYYHETFCFYVVLS